MPSARHVSKPRVDDALIDTADTADTADTTDTLDTNSPAKLQRYQPPVAAFGIGPATLKRVIDLVGATVGLVLAAPILAALALFVKVESPGPALFSQTRVGRGGRPFRMFKLRTMHDGADDEKAAVAHLNASADVRLFKIRSDPRTTRVGAILRRWSLDELPQLYNVLVGDMSLVGPRPFMQTDLIHYEPHHFDRFLVRPGITGLWQVSGRSEIVDFEEVIRLDREYIRSWSPWLDLIVLARTLPTVVRRRGAY